MFLAIQKRAALTNVKKGFTLIELIIVIVILVILAAIAIPAIMNYVKQANEARTIANARSVYSAACLAVADAVMKGNTPVAGTSITTLSANIKTNAGVTSAAAFTGTINASGAIDNFTYTETPITVERNAAGQFVIKTS